LLPSGGEETSGHDAVVGDCVPNETQAAKMLGQRLEADFVFPADVRCYGPRDDVRLEKRENPPSRVS
jgi:hypothetical protein